MKKELYVPPEGEPRADVAPNMIGNRGVKELILAAACFFDPKSAKQTSIPILIIARSGGGKSAFFEGMKESFGNSADIYPVDALTSGQVRGMKRGKKVIRAHLAFISLFDEINKWMQSYMESILIPVFGAESGVRFREGEEMPEGVFDTLPIGTLLPFWQDFEGGGAEASKKIHNIQQIMRRSLLLRLDEDCSTDEFLSDYIDQVASQLWTNIEYKGSYDAEQNYDQLVRVVRQAHELSDRYKIRFQGGPEYVEAKKRIIFTTHRIQFSDRVVYDRAFSRGMMKLATGLALRYGRTIVYPDDINRVCDILEGNAKALGFWKIICEECRFVCTPGTTKCGKCGARLPE